MIQGSQCGQIETFTVTYSISHVHPQADTYPQTPPPTYVGGQKKILIRPPVFSVCPLRSHLTSLWSTSIPRKYNIMANPGTISTRMSKTVQAFAPIASAVASRKDKDQPTEGHINLGDGENTLMKTEMVGIYQEAMQKSVTAKVNTQPCLFRFSQVKSHCSYYVEHQTFANPDGFSTDPALREALAKYVTAYFQPAIPVTLENIVPTAGSGPALDALLFTICDAGDSVLCPAPAWCTSPCLSHNNRSINPTIPTIQTIHFQFNTIQSKKKKKKI